MEEKIYYPITEWISVDEWPLADFLPDSLDNVYLAPPELDGNTGDSLYELLFLQELKLQLPGMDFLSLGLGKVPGTTARVQLTDSPFKLSIEADFVLHVSASVLRPVELKQGTPDQIWEPDYTARTLDITLGTIALVIDANGFQLNFKSPAINVPRCMVGDTGIILSIGSMRWESPAKLYLDDVEAIIPQLPQSVSRLKMDDVVLGTGGFSGTLSVEDPAGSLKWDTSQSPAKFIGGVATGELFGFKCGLRKIQISIVQNCLTGSSILGELFVPYLEKRIGIDLKLGMDNNLRVGLASPQAQNPEEAAELGSDGLLHFKIQSVLEAKVNSLTFESDDVAVEVIVSGKLKPLITDITWPEFEIKALAIDSQGRVKIEGGWLDLSEQKPLRFHDFEFEITKLGFGHTEDNKYWIGFTGGIKLVEGLPAGVSVEGLRITWDPTGDDPIAITLNGVGVEFTIPDVLQFKGAVSYNTIQEGAQTIHRFDGTIKLNITTLDLQVDAVLVIGSNTGPEGQYNFFAIYTGIELPVGIPLGNSSLAIYGFSGLFAYQMEPNKGLAPRLPAEGWYDNEDGSPGWYKRDEIGVTDLKKKWTPRRDSLALGSGATIGTLQDSGTAFHGTFLLAIVFPGPIIMMEGRGNLLKKRADANGKSKTVSEPLFRSISVFDFRLGTITIGLMAWYKYDDEGGVIDITGSAEGFFDFNDPGAWHVYIGRDEPQQYRVQAYLLKRLIKANSYFMLSKKSFKTGAWAGIQYNWNYGPLRANLEASLDGNAHVSHKPPQFHTDLLFRGSLGLTVFGFGATIGLESLASADFPEPTHLLLQVSGELNLPWPLKSYKAVWKKEWGPYPKPPPLAVILKEIAIEHLKAATTWPLPLPPPESLTASDGGWLMAPDYDNGDGFLKDTAIFVPDPTRLELDPIQIPVIPLDGKPHIAFGRALIDYGFVGVNIQPGDKQVQPAEEGERIGDPVSGQGPVNVRFGLIGIELHEWMNGTSPHWELVARSMSKRNPKPQEKPAWVLDSNPAGVPRLSGSWAPVPGNEPGSVSQTKLWLWSRNAFDYTRHGGSSWSEGFVNANPLYPCVPDAPEREMCCNFADLEPGIVLKSPWRCPEHPEVTLTWSAGGDPTVTVLDEPIEEFTRALCFPGSVDTPGGSIPNEIAIQFPEGTPARQVTITPAGRDDDTRECLYFEGRPVGSRVRQEKGIRFSRIRGIPVPPGARVETLNGISGLDCRQDLRVDFPRPCFNVELIVTSEGAFVVQVICRSGKVIPVPGIQGDRRQVQIQQPDIIALTIEGASLLNQMCLDYVRLDAEGTDSGGATLLGELSNTGTVTLPGAQLQTVKIRGGEHICLGQICAVLPPDPAEVARRQAMTQHFQDELARWYAEDHLLEPDTIYRLTVVTNVKAVGEGELAGYEKDRDVTQYAFFRTAGAPGVTRLSLPAGTDTDGVAVLRNGEGQVITVNENTGSRLVLKSGLNDLTLYVRQTVPPTVPGPREQPPLPRPVYRAYDTGVEFNENYVELMYRLQRRGLGLYLFDSNNRAARDAEGRLIILPNRWGSVEDLWLSESELLWISRVNANNCAELEIDKLPRHKTLTSNSGLVLEGDIVYEARFIPLLLDEDFSGTLAPWRIMDDLSAKSDWQIRKPLSGAEATVVDNSAILNHVQDLPGVDLSAAVLVLDADTARASKSYLVVSIENIDDQTKKLTLDGTPKLSADPSPWRIPMIGVEQLSAINGGTTDGRDPNKPGTLLLAGDASWTDYRLSVVMRSWKNGAIGLVFRVKDSTHYYRFSMSREHRYRRLTRVSDNDHRILAEDYFVYETNRDYHVIVEIVGDWIRLYVDADLIYDMHDTSIAAGGVGLYSWNNPGARFSNVRVDDLGELAPIVYRYKFTTSRFGDFFHHLHSFQDEVWKTTLASTELPALDLQTIASKASQFDASATEDEARGYDKLIRKILPNSADQNPSQIQVTRVDYDQKPAAFIVQSPEPIDWKRTTLHVSYNAQQGIAHDIPSAVKMTGVGVGSGDPNEEWVDILTRDATDLNRYRIEYLHFPSSELEPQDADILFEDSFEAAPAGLLFEEVFGPNALDHYTIVDEEPPSSSPHDWKIANERIEQHSRYRGGSATEYDLPKRPGTIALLNSGSWSNVRIKAVFRSDSWHDIGIVFRCEDVNNYYRFSVSRYLNTPISPFRRLVRKVDGVVEVLWEDAVTTDTSVPCHVTIEIVKDRISGYLNDELLFSVLDSSLSAGSVGWYCWGNDRAYFEDLEVEALGEDPTLWHPSFQALSEVQVIEPENAVASPSHWQVQNGVLQQLSKISALEGAMEVLPGAANDIAVGPNGMVAVVGVDKTSDGFGVHIWRDAVWQRIGDDAVRIAAGPGDTLAWVTESGRVIYWSQGTPRQLPASGTDLAIGAAGSIWLIGKQPVPGGFEIYRWDGLQLVLTGMSALRIAAGPDGIVWAVNDVHQIFRLDASGWQQMPGQANDIGVGADGSVWIVSNNPAGVNFGISRWNGKDWEDMFGSAVAIAVDPNGKPWLIQTDRSIWRWAGQPLHKPGTFALGGDAAWEDVQISTRLRADSDGALGVMFRYTDGDNYYRFAMDREEGVWRLIKRFNGAVTLLKEATWQYTRNQPYELRLRAIGNKLDGWLDGVSLFGLFDDDLTHGKVGLYCRKNDAAYFERVHVADRTRRVGDWIIHDEGEQDAPSVWRLGAGAFVQTSTIRGGATDVPGTYAIAGEPPWSDTRLSVRLRSDEPGTIGVLLRFVDSDNYYRFSMDEGNHYRRLIKKTDGNVTTLWEDKAQGYKVGDAHMLTAEARGAELRIYLDDVRLCQVTDATHTSGRIGLYCANNSGAHFEDVQVTAFPTLSPFSGWLLKDSFDVSVEGRWTFQDRGNWRGPSQWGVNGGELRQWSDISYLPIPGSFVRGEPATLAVAGDPKWTDYKLAVTLGSYHVLGPSPNEIGVVFRHQDADNYYWFTLNYQTGVRQLLSRVGGQPTILWTANAVNNLGQIYHLEIECIGQNLRGYLREDLAADRALLFDVSDMGLSAGRVGLACTGNSAAFFQDAVVTPAIWKLYYTFQREVRMPAGTRLRVHSGNSANAPALAPNVSYRFVASLEESGRRYFETTHADLRLRAPDGRVEHKRRFWDPSGFAPVISNDWRVLRKADGTGFFLFKSDIGAPTAKGLDVGQYRLDFEYRRDNRQKDPGSIVLSKGGYKGSETVMIGVPWQPSNEE